MSNLEELRAYQPKLRFLTPAELHAETPPEPDWLLDGYLAPGVLTIGPAGKPKVGKSTLMLAIVRAIRADAGTFLGRTVRTTTVVYLSEEGASTLVHKLPADDPGLHILTRDHAWPRPPWPELAAASTDYALTVNAGLMVVDTFAFWAALAAEKEKDAGAVQQAIEPLYDATRQGLAVMVGAHTRKSGGEDGDALRGSGALGGAGDIILELERPTGQNPPPRQRVLLSLSRYPKTPGSLVFDYDARTDSWAAIAEGESRHDSRAASDRAALLAMLPTTTPGMTRQELEDELGSPHKQFAPILKDLLDENIAARDGDGVKGDPFRFRILRNGSAQHRAETPTFLSAHSPLGDAERNEAETALAVGAQYSAQGPWTDPDDLEVTP
jgi:hypothetical protein